MKEISAPVVAIALILAAVFVPVGFIPGIVGRLYQQFAITIAISVILSAFVALSLDTGPLHLVVKAHRTLQRNQTVWISSSIGSIIGLNELTDKYTNGVQKKYQGTQGLLSFFTVHLRRRLVFV